MNIALLKKRILETPLMEPVDAVKLVYQNEFGCGHLILDEASAAARIVEEIRQTSPNPTAVPYVNIGNGLCRLNLCAESVRRLPVQVIARMMVQTSLQWTGSQEGLRPKLEALKEAVASLKQDTARPTAGEGGSTALPSPPLAFSPTDLDSYLKAYAAQGYPMVRHSARYRTAYAPAYRVVHHVYGLAVPLLEAIQHQLSAYGHALLVLDGDCASGKTTLAEAIAPLLDATLIHMDDFFLPPELRTEKRLQTPGGNVHYERFADQVLTPLSQGSPFCYHRYDCQSGAFVPREVQPAPVCIIEGSYSHHPVFHDLYASMHAVKVFLSIDGPEQLSRLTARNAKLLPRFQAEWIPLEKKYFRAYDIQQRADFSLRMDHQSDWEPKEAANEAIGH